MEKFLWCSQVVTQRMRTYYFNDIETADLGQYLYISPGDYVAYGVDGNGCISDEISVSVTSPDELSLMLTVSDVLCNGGQIVAEVELNSGRWRRRV